MEYIFTMTYLYIGKADVLPLGIVVVNHCLQAMTSQGNHDSSHSKECTLIPPRTFYKYSRRSKPLFK